VTSMTRVATTSTTTATAAKTHSGNTADDTSDPTCGLDSSGSAIRLISLTSALPTPRSTARRMFTRAASDTYTPYCSAPRFRITSGTATSVTARLASRASPEANPVASMRRARSLPAVRPATLMTLLSSDPRHHLA